ncbi:MAG: crotonase/enoyl-CoA hydratase family protein [Parahaliea sp.]
MPPSFETLTLAIDDSIARVSLNRPERANAMNAPMWRELQSCFEWLDAEPGVRVVILAGNGRHFCSGIDLGMFGAVLEHHPEPARRAEKLRRTILGMQDNLSALEKCCKPVLAAIHNACIGGGMDLTCCCDMRYASADARFSIREIDIGMTADVGTLQRLPHLIPQGVVRELAYTGRDMDAEEACRLGFINRVFADRDALDAGVREIARQIAGKSPLAVRGSKEMLLYTRDHPVTDGLNYIATWNAGMLSDADLNAGITAQAQKTTPAYDD